MESTSHLHALTATRDVRNHRIGLIVELIGKAMEVWFLFVFDRETAALIREANEDWRAISDP